MKNSELIAEIRSLWVGHEFCLPGDLCWLCDDLGDLLKRNPAKQPKFKAPKPAYLCSVEGCKSVLTITSVGNICRECRFDQKRAR